MDVKPCDMPCEKCGGSDVGRIFRANGDMHSIADYGKARNRYASGTSYVATTYRDHIDHTCRTCQYNWQTMPMKKPKRVRLVPSAEGGHE